MRSKELPAELRDRIVSKHRSGEGSKTNSAALKLPPLLEEVWNNLDLPRSGRLVKLCNRGRRALFLLCHYGVLSVNLLK